MVQQDAAKLAAAELADHYIEIILSTKPELLISHVGGSTDLGDIQASASALGLFRFSLIQQLSDQPLPLADTED